jgi:hypothetical protein
MDPPDRARPDQALMPLCVRRLFRMGCHDNAHRAEATGPVPGSPRCDGAHRETRPSPPVPSEGIGDSSAAANYALFHVFRVARVAFAVSPARRGVLWLSTSIDIDSWVSISSTICVILFALRYRLRRPDPGRMVTGELHYSAQEVLPGSARGNEVNAAIERDDKAALTTRSCAEAAAKR